MDTSKKAGAVPEETKERILTAARAEFSEHGFQGSSLRRICSAAGVTTGALYFFFQGKDDLFQTVLAQVTEPFAQLVEAHYQRECGSGGGVTEEGADADFEVTERLLDLYFSNRQTWGILTRHLNHPAVQSFLDRFVEVSTAHYQALLEKTALPQAVDGFALHQFVHMQVDTMLTLFSHGFSREEMSAHSRTIVRMLRGAYAALVSEPGIRG